MTTQMPGCSTIGRPNDRSIGLAHTPADIERVVLFLYPTIIIVFARLFNRTAIRGSDITALGLSYAGVVLVFVGQPNGYTSGDNVVFGVALDGHDRSGSGCLARHPRLPRTERSQRVDSAYVVSGGRMLQAGKREVRSRSGHGEDILMPSNDLVND